MEQLTVVTQGQYQYQYHMRYRDLDTTSAPRTMLQLHELATGGLEGDICRSTPVDSSLVPAQVCVRVRAVRTAGGISTSQVRVCHRQCSPNSPRTLEGMTRISPSRVYLQEIYRDSGTRRIMDTVSFTYLVSMDQQWTTTTVSSVLRISVTRWVINRCACIASEF
jgi:hypothetical protein